MFGIFSKKSEPAKLWFKTDIHCHILPGIDDGAPDVDTSLNLIKGLTELGIERIIASPHIAAVQFPNTAETLGEAFAELTKALNESGFDVPVSHSAEYRIDEDFPEIIEKGKIIPYPENYVLIENQWIQEPLNLEQVIFDLQVRRFQPVLAHPERFSYYQSNPSRLDQLHDKIPFQINVLSLAGYYGRAPQRLAESLLKKGYGDFLGTDTHNSKHIECLRKYARSGAAKKHRDWTANTLLNDRVFLNP